MKNRHIAKLADGKPFTLIRYAMTCVCGKVFDSKKMARSAAIADVEAQIDCHVQHCDAYKYMADPAIRGISAEKLIEALSK